MVRIQVFAITSISLSLKASFEFSLISAGVKTMPPTLPQKVTGTLPCTAILTSSSIWPVLSSNTLSDLGTYRLSYCFVEMANR